MEKFYTSKTFSKMAGGRLHTPHSIPLDPPLAISYRDHQKSLVYFSHLALLALFFFTAQMAFFLLLTAQTAEWYGASVSGAVDLGLIPIRVKLMTLKLVFTASLLDAQH